MARKLPGRQSGCVLYDIGHDNAKRCGIKLCSRKLCGTQRSAALRRKHRTVRFCFRLPRGRFSPNIHSGWRHLLERPTCDIDQFH